MAGFMYGGGGGGGGGITSVSGTTGQINANTVGGAVTLSMPTAVTITGVQEAGGFKTNGDEILVGQGVTAAFEKNRTFTVRKHIPISSTTVGSYVDIISWRPYQEGTTNDPTAGSFWGAVSFKINLTGHISGIGNGYRRMCGVVYFDGSSASSAASPVNNTNGSVTDFRVNRAGWVSTLQYQITAPATNFNGMAYVEIHFARGAGSAGNAITWNIT